MSVCLGIFCIRDMRPVEKMKTVFFHMLASFKALVKLFTPSSMAETIPVNEDWCKIFQCIFHDQHHSFKYKQYHVSLSPESLYWQRNAEKLEMLKGEKVNKRNIKQIKLDHFVGIQCHICSHFGLADIAVTESLVRAF